jgi:hypothetical protein
MGWERKQNPNFLWRGEAAPQKIGILLIRRFFKAYDSNFSLVALVG